MAIGCPRWLPSVHLHQKWECWGRKRLPSLLWMRMWKGHRQWSHISTSPVTLNTPLDKCLSLSFHVSVLHKFTSIESGGLAVLFTTREIKNQRLGKKSLFSTIGVEQENLVTKLGVQNRICIICGAWCAVIYWSCRCGLEHRQRCTCCVKNAPYGLVWPLCTGWK